MISNYCTKFFSSIMNLFFGALNNEFIVHTTILVLKILVCLFQRVKNNIGQPIALQDIDFTYIFWQYVAIALAHNMDRLELGNFELRKLVLYSCIFFNTKVILKAFADSGMQIPSAIMRLIDAMMNYFA